MIILVKNQSRGIFPIRTTVGQGSAVLASKWRKVGCLLFFFFVVFFLFFFRSFIISYLFILSSPLRSSDHKIHLVIMKGSSL